MVHYNMSYLSKFGKENFSGLTESRRITGNLSVASYKNGGILPSLRKNILVYEYGGGVVDAQGSFVSGTGLHEPPCVVGDAYPATYRYSDQIVIYIGFLLFEWGNTITDSLKKLWFLHTEQGRQLLRDGAQVVYVTFENKPLKEYQIELFRLAGFDANSWKQITSPLRFREVLIPGNSFITTAEDRRFYYPEFVQTIQDIKAKAFAATENQKQPSFPEKIYLTRTKWGNRRDSNEKKLEDLFRQLGFQILSPEQFSVVQQIVMLAKCNVMAATEGSVSHNALFMSPGAELIVLQKADYLNDYQMLINEISDLRVTYIPAHSSTRVSKEMPWVGPFYLNITPQLRAWSGLPLKEVPVILQPAYWKYCFLYSSWFQAIKLRAYLIYRKIRSQSKETCD